MASLLSLLVNLKIFQVLCLGRGGLLLIVLLDGIADALPLLLNTGLLNPVLFHDEPALILRPQEIG